MTTTTSTSMLWTEMTDDSSEAVNGGKYWSYKSYYHCEKPKEEKKYRDESSYCWEDKKYDKCNSYPKKWW
jgi:hypothetical protein